MQKEIPLINRTAALDTFSSDYSLLRKTGTKGTESQLFHSTVSEGRLIFRQRPSGYKQKVDASNYAFKENNLATHRASNHVHGSVAQSNNIAGSGAGESKAESGIESSDVQSLNKFSR